MQRRKSFFNNELEQRFSLRKYTIGLCSVCLGFVAIGMGNQTVKADTVNGAEKSPVVQENKAQETNSANTDALAESKANTSDSANAKSNTTPIETKENEAGSVDAPKANATSTSANANTATPTETKLDKASSAAANSNNASAETKLDNASSAAANSNNASAQAKSTKAESVVQPKVSGTSTETKSNEHSLDAVNPNAVSTESKLNTAVPSSLATIKPQRMRFAKLADAKALAESKVATDNQFNFDDWTTQVDDTYLNITGYNGDRSKQIVVPNGADFAKAGKNDKNLQVEIDPDTLKGLIVDGVAPKLSNTDGQKIVAKGDDWSSAFSNKNLYDISGLANLDTSNVTDMDRMFSRNRISDLSPLANWNTGNVTDMYDMFYFNQISDLSPLANWNTGKVTDMDSMFDSNRISDLTPLANWKTGNVTNMDSMFDSNRISDLTPLANWKTGNVTNMSAMFRYNQIIDLSPLANWNTGKVTDMHNMFYGNQISDLSPLANWNTGKVTDMRGMFHGNQISDLSPLANWKTGNVTDMSSMFYLNQISDLSPLANWNTGNVTDMGYMFSNNQISDLTPLANWNTGNVTDMRGMFSNNQISDLTPLANWNTGNVTDMGYMFSNNRISDLSPLANWNTGKVTNMDKMFAKNPLTATVNSQSTLNKFYASVYKFDNISALASHNESKTFNDGSQISLDKNVVTENDSATLTFKANGLTGNTYQIKIYNPDESINIQAAPLPTALGTTDTSYQNGYTIITNKFINNGSVKQDISIAQDRYYRDPRDKPIFAQYESTSGLITVAKNKKDLDSINITYQNVSDIDSYIYAPSIGKKPYINNTQNTFYFDPTIAGDNSANDRYSFIKSAELTITVPDEVTIDPNTFIDAKTGKTLKGAKIADHQYQAVLDNTVDGIAVKGLINVPANKLTSGTARLPGFDIKYTIHTYNDKVAPVVATNPSNDLAVIPDLASYHGALIEINQSKWAFDRNGNRVDDYTEQGFTNRFNGVPLEPAVSTQVTNGVETFDMPTGVNITYFRPPFNEDVIDHIGYVYTDGSKQTVSDFNTTPKAIRQMKIYFKNGIQGDELASWTNSLGLSFDAAYPDGTPIKNFDTFKITGSFSCDELGSADNIDLAQVMLAPTQKLTDGMVTDTDQDESNKVPNASGNFINAKILNDNVPQHQGHLTNPIFYFKYNDLMVPDLSKISASYDNQNKNLGSTGFTDIDKDKIHSSIITDSTGQKFVKVQIDGEYYYVGSSYPKPGFNVKIPISNTPDALSATKDWSWYILNNNDEAKTESAIQNPKQSSSQDNKPDPVTVDGNTLSVGGTGTWQIITAQGFTSGTETQGNLNGGPGLASTQDDHQQDPTHFTIYDSIINATNDAKSDLVSVANLPSTQDGKSQFDVQMTGKASLINAMTGQTYDATITYSYGTGDNNFITGDQVTDWSKVKSIKVVPNGGAPSMTSLRLVVPVEDKTVYDDVGKTIYMSTMTYGEDKTNTNYTTKDGFAVPEKSTILPIIIKPGDMASAKLTVQGQATVHTLVHYKDANGKDVYVKLPDQDKTYKELQDTMKRSDYLQSDRDLTIADRGLLPVGMVINYNNPTIRNSNNTYAAGYANGTAAFDKTAKYDFDGDQVIFEGAMPEIVTRTHQAKETIHYIYRDGRTAAPDKVLTSITLKQTGTKNPFTNEITWNTSATDTLNSVDSPKITGYIADKLTVPSYVVTMDSPDKEVTVTYDADNENADFTYFDDTKNSALKVVKKSGKSNTAIGYTTTDEINSYEKQGYVLVSDDTNGHSLNFDSLPTVDQHYMIHLKHKTESVTRNDTVTRIIHYLYDNGNTAKPDKTQTVSFNETGTKDDVTGKTTWDNDDAQTVNSVTTPSITGYTPDQSSIERQSFNFGDPDINVTVTYHANTQNAKITYIDDTTKTNLKSKDTSGKFGQAITFATAPADEIANYEKQGYVFVSSTFDNNKYQADNSSNVFEVHLKHGTKKVSRTDDVNMTVHYVMDDNSKAPSDHKQTVSFTEDGTQDLVTKHIDWTPADSQTFKDVATKTIVGYTPDKENVAGQTVNFGAKDINVTVHYNANTQTATITYIDDTTKTNLKSKETSGKFGQAITFETTPTVEIENYKKQGYVLVSSTFDNNKYQADNKFNSFEVHLKHGTKKVSRNDDVKMTVHYVMDDNSEAPSDNKQTVNFTENGIQDLVTKHIDWTPAASQTFKDVDSPVLTGYTADIKTANGKVVNFGDNDINVTVTYHANAQTATITYIDDTEKKTLGSDNQNGKFNQVIAFEHDPAEVIKGLEEKGYVFVSSTFDNNKYQADNKFNSFEVHLKHGTKKVSRNDDVKMTVHYVMDDGSKAPSDNKQTVNFTENGIQDLVTKHIDWTPAESQTFKDVVTPKVAGYTPDQDKVTGQTVNFGDNDINVTVTYSPNVQIGHINYIDDNTGKTLTRDDFSGRTNEHEDYTSTDRIQEFENKGYVFVSSDYPDGGFNFDNNDRQDQVFNVHFKHGIVTVTSKNPQIPNTPIDPDPHSPKYPEDISNTNSDVKRTIDYTFKDGKTAQPTVKDSLHFERTVVIDKVTGDVLSDTWTQSQNFSDIQTPAIQGYTPDRIVVSDKNIGHDHQDIIEHVVYNPDAQHMTITYIDDTTGKTLHTDNPNGVSDQDAKYTTGDNIKQYEDQHYKLVSDSTKGQDLIFDHDDDANQTYEVHFVHGKHAINQTTSPKQTIHYVYANGLVRQGKAADDNVQQLSFKRDGYNDEVTGIDHWNAWTPANSKYNAVDSPVIQGYTPDKLVVEKSTVNPTDKDTEVTVTYSADKQAARVIYVDQTTNTTLTSKDLSGKSDEDSEYNTKDTIGQYQSQHYVLAGDETDGKNVVFDHDDQQDQTYYVYFVHGTQKVNRQSAVTSTIDYKFEDGKTAQPTVTQTKYFSENGIEDLVTNKITWDEAKPQKFEDVATKSIVGYTPDKDEVAGSTVNFGDKDITETVTYHNNAQKAVITYVDDMTKKTLASDSQDGKFDHEITFEHDPAEVINSLKEKGYKLVSNDFKDGTKYKADDKQNEFIVHLTHDKQKVNRQDQVVETIHYVYEDGSKSQPDHKQTISFTEDGSKDLVTGKIAWTPADSQKFDDVATPVITGYTPDKSNVTGSTVRFGDKDVEVTVTYHNNAQTAKITYIDDTAKKTLASDSQNGKFNQVITFEHDPAEVINGLEEKGYKLVSNNFKDGTKYKADDKQNEFIVHLTHGTHAISDKKAITETITYKMSDGSKAPDQVEKQVEFSRDGYNDEVTKQDHWNKWQPDKQSFNAVPTPEVKGYTPDIKSVETKTVTSGDKDITVTVTYTPDQQKAKVVFIDDTTKKTLDTHNLTGVTNGHEKYSPSEEIEKFIHENYVFVSSDYPEKGFTYDNDDGKDQVFEVHLKEVPTESDTPIIPGNTEDNGGSNDTSTDSDNPEKDNGGSDTVDKSSHKTPVNRKDNKKHHGTKKTNAKKNANKTNIQKNADKTNIQKTSKTVKLNPNRLAQPKLKKVNESTNRVNRVKHDALPQTGEKRSSLIAMLGLAISGLGMIGAMKSKKRKDD